ncbi:hypothetical protein LCGC14_0431610 [marine sediment metagenome]|uniref:TFIIS-type domain-containing protein n=1 Tax=marine sediment metagenome TaxID=412755 RepID=A0A0F9V9Z5_9ZZZZ
MSQAKTPKRLEIADELRACPECDYTNGFHVSFVRRESGGVRIVLICPSCSARFDVDWAMAGS